MEIFKAIRFTETEIVLDDATKLDSLFNMISGDEPFIINWNEHGISHSQVIVSNHISGKLKNGEITLKAEEKGE